MAYIGRDISNLSDRVVLDSITASATATYNLTLNSVAYVPSSAESLTVSLNGVIQKPQGSYTVSNATIVFASALTSSDSIDFIIAERSITLTGVGSGTVGTTQLVDGSVSNTKLENSSITLNGSAVSLGGSATIGGGKIGQVVSTTKTDKSTFAVTSFTSISGFNVSITPTATSSKIYVMCSIAYGTTSNVYGGFRLLRDSTAIAIGDADGVKHQATMTASNGVFGRAVNTDFNFLDSPNTTSATTYQIQVKINGSQSLNINSSGEDENNTDTGFRYVSTITAMEVLA